MSGIIPENTAPIEIDGEVVGYLWVRDSGTLGLFFYDQGVRDRVRNAIAQEYINKVDILIDEPKPPRVYGHLRSL